MDQRPALGRHGEDAAADLYRRLGFKVLERNFRCPGGELDLVARRGRLVVFCEVKTRRTDRWGPPSDAVDRSKRVRIRRLAAEWLHHRRPGAVEVRFDVVSVIVGEKDDYVTHIPGAF